MAKNPTFLNTSQTGPEEAKMFSFPPLAKRSVKMKYFLHIFALQLIQYIMKNKLSFQKTY